MRRDKIIPLTPKSLDSTYRKGSTKTSATPILALHHIGSRTKMTVLERVQDLLSRYKGKPLCDDCIAELLELTVRQHANRKTRLLAKDAGYIRALGDCSRCKGQKLAITSL
jgi:hypothetical protein